MSYFITSTLRAQSYFLKHAIQFCYHLSLIKYNTVTVTALSRYCSTATSAIDRRRRLAVVVAGKALFRAITRLLGPRWRATVIEYVYREVHWPWSAANRLIASE